MGTAQIQSYIQQLTKKYKEVISVEVTSVAFPYFDAETPSGEEIKNLLLVSEESDNGIYCIPTIGSNVIVGMLDDTKGYIICYAEIDEVVLHGDQYGGIVKVSELVTKLNNLENKVNTLINTFNAHVHPGVLVGPTSTGVTATPVSGTLTPTQIADIENDKVKHG